MDALQTFELVKTVILVLIMSGVLYVANNASEQKVER